MKRVFFILMVFISVTSFSQDEEKWHTVNSITEWVDEINSWPEDLYEVDNLELKIDSIRDKKHIDLGDNIWNKPIDTSYYLVVNKPIKLNRFRIKEYGIPNSAIKNISFEKSIYIQHMEGLFTFFKNIQFQDELIIRRHEVKHQHVFIHCQFEKVTVQELFNSLFLQFHNCRFLGDFYLSNHTNSTPGIAFMNSKLDRYLEFELRTNLGNVMIHSTSIFEELDLENVMIKNALYFINSDLGSIELEGASLPVENTYIPFEAISNKIMLERGIRIITQSQYKADTVTDFADEFSYNLLMSSYSKLLNIYQNRSDYASYNACYIEMRDKQTAYYQYQLTNDPSFDNWLVYQLNVFLKAFSDYGTKPTKAILISIYVILAFALVYLFFPNSWDSHGKNRLKDRYLFFLKYLSLNKGIRDVYLEEKKGEIEEGEKFKAILEKHKDDAPAIFYHTAIPLYKWSMAGTRTYSRLIQNFDFLKGKWKETDPKIRPLRTGLVVLMFAISLTYDLFIKILNAVMLSINTFTTLGFGEIPIKGLPRYLAIIQGFIGWFMLTIFSVSLISQLLN